MEFKNKTFTTSPEDIFLNDRLDRAESVENIYRLLNNVSSPLVFSVNAPWGAGKTSFLKMLSARLKRSDRKTVYFSAWETDFADDPLLAFLGEMNLALAPYIDGNAKRKKAWLSVKKAGTYILKRTLPVAIKVGTAGLIDADKLLEDEAAKLAEGVSKDLIDKYAGDKASILKFKSSVKDLCVAMDGEEEKLYIFIDELDRCRPTYAIELLERIKHLLDVEGLVFVLALDKIQLAHSVKAVYGNDFDASGYLKRFIDIEYSLPSASVNQFIDHLYEHFGFSAFFKEREKLASTRGDGMALKRALTYFCMQTGMSLRSIEQLVAKLNLVLLMVKPNQFLYPLFLVFLMVAKENYADIYQFFIDEKNNGEKMIDLLNRLMPGLTPDLVSIRADIESMIIASKAETSKSWYDKRLRDLDDASEVDTNDLKLRRYCADVYRSAISYSGSGFPLDKMISRINMLDNFLFEKSE